MSPTPRLSALLAMARDGEDRLGVAALAARQEAAFRAFDAYLAAPGRRVYGANTLPGHRDGEPIAPEAADAYAQAFLAAHAIGGPPWFDAPTARAIGLAKLWSLDAGGAPLSGAVTRRVAEATLDPAFNPLAPRRASYSSGDVIPAAHWARAALAHGRAPAPALAPVEAMTLVNGTFVAVGAAAALAPALGAFWRLFALLAAETALASGVSRGAFSARLFPPDPALAALLDAMARDLPEAERARQAPVSARTLPQQTACLFAAARDWLAEIDGALGQPACNPLFFADEGRHVANGGFLAPGLTVRSGALIEALLMVAWGAAQAAQHAGGDAPPGHGPDAGPGLIQWPKHAQARLERLRHRAGMRAFASGASTSHGVEDLWCHALTTLETLEEALSETRAIALIALHQLVWARREAGGRIGALAGAFFGAAGAQGDAAEALERLARLVEARADPGPFAI
ncbi:aromatic amino acid lyase [Rubrimonas cliftonensis]|uniref:Histidine ammonia-lyase n=1 Tax=Rubrimonas cliftonensis TaxID=89524 RepID=A0A1H4E2U9_9RHOB|nr:aromatic amino acid lyase [Rubrimonas cliftonensis]SEA79345.1 Histidine ammonia-lyase [Rubrimonas cliftonensis]